MQLTGKIKTIGDLQTFPTGFQKRDMVITTEEQYPQPILIEFLSEKSDLPEPYKPGDSVTVSINLRGREWQSPQGETRYFNSIVGWKIQHAGDIPASGKTSQNSAPTNEPLFQDEEDDDQLPFN